MSVDAMLLRRIAARPTARSPGRVRAAAEFFHSAGAVFAKAGHPSPKVARSSRFFGLPTGPSYTA